MAHRWYVLHVYSGFENKVSEAIQEKARKLKLLKSNMVICMFPLEIGAELKRKMKQTLEK